MAIFAMTSRNATTTNVDQMAFSMPNAPSAPSTKQSARLHQPRVSSFGEGAPARILASIRAARCCRQPDFNPVSFI
jgi:hypothetical protein